MNLFTLFGTIALDNSKANMGIDETTKKASDADKKTGSSFGNMGKSFDAFGQKIQGGQSVISGFVSRVSGSLTVVQDFGAKITSVGTHVQDFSGKMKEFGKSGVTGKVAMAGVVASVGLLSAAIPGAISRVDTLNNYPKIMKQMGYSTDETKKSIDILKKGIDGLPTPLNEITKSSQSFAILEKSATKGAQTATALNDAFFASGASSADASRGVEQYSQMLASGTVDMQSWRTLQETMPYALTKTANAFGLTGKSAERDLYKKLQSGQITMEQLNEKFVELDGGMNGFAATARTATGGIGTSFANAKTAVTKGVADILVAIGTNNIESVIKKIGVSFKSGLDIIASSTTNVKNFVQQNSTFMMPIIKVALSFVGGLIALKGAALLLVPVVSTLGGGLKVLGTIISLMASPITLTIAAIAAIGVALYAFFTKTEAGKQAFQSLVDFFNSTLIPIFDKMKTQFGLAMNTVVVLANHGAEILNSVMQSIGNFISTHWATISSVIGAAMGAISTLISQGVQIWQTLIEPIVDGIVNFISENWNNIALIIGAVMVVIIGIIKLVMSLITGDWSGAWNAIVQIFTGIWQIISGIVMYYVNLLVGIFQALWGLLGATVTAGWNVIVALFMGSVSVLVAMLSAFGQAILTIIGGVWDLVVALFTGAWNLIVAIVTGAIQLVGTIISMTVQGWVMIFQAIWDAIVAVTTAVWSVIGSSVMAGIDFIVSVINAGMSLLQTIVQGIWDTIVAVFNIALGLIGVVLATAWNGFAAVFNAIMPTIIQIVTNAFNVIGQTISTIMNFIMSTISIIWNQVASVTSTVWNAIYSVIMSVVNATQAIIVVVWNALVGITVSAFNSIMSVASSIWNALVNIITAAVNGIRNTVTAIWNGLVGITSAAFSSIMSAASSIWNAVLNVISSIVNGVRNTVSSGFNALVGIVSGVFNSVVSTISGIFNGAVSIVSGIVERIKSLFNFQLKFPDIHIPHIPLPHFSLSGSFDPLKGKIPSVGIDWFAKGGLMNGPTMFGMNGNRAMVGGEAGQEAIMPLNKSVLGMIADKITANMDTPNSKGDTNVEFTQNITMPAYSTPREMQRQAQQQFEKAFNPA
ncbi:tape measure protein [Leuconostoc citreum]|uniref:tape measure protein n=2 Tax=Leuconostoc citreum TaxID=33964 RepID=UPI0032DF8162